MIPVFARSSPRSTAAAAAVHPVRRETSRNTLVTHSRAGHNICVCKLSVFTTTTTTIAATTITTITRV